MTTVNVSIPHISVPRVNKDTGRSNDAWYRFDETMFRRLGGENGDRFSAVDTSLATLSSGKADKTITVTAGNGLSGGGDLSANFTISADKDTGWTAATGGTANKGTFAAYTGQTVSATPTQTEVQQIDDQLVALTNRVLALEAALRANGGIDG